MVFWGAKGKRQCTGQRRQNLRRRLPRAPPCSGVTLSLTQGTARAGCITKQRALGQLQRYTLQRLRRWRVGCITTRGEGERSARLGQAGRGCVDGLSCVRVRLVPWKQHRRVECRVVARASITCLPVVRALAGLNVPNAVRILRHAAYMRRNDAYMRSRRA